MASEGKWLSVQETLTILRATGMSISQQFLQDGIESGIFPFGFCIKGNERRFFISRRKVNEWLAEWAG